MRRTLFWPINTPTSFISPPPFDSIAPFRSIPRCHPPHVLYPSRPPRVSSNPKHLRFARVDESADFFCQLPIHLSCQYSALAYFVSDCFQLLIRLNLPEFDFPLFLSCSDVDSDSMGRGAGYDGHLFRLLSLLMRFFLFLLPFIGNLGFYFVLNRRPILFPCLICVSGFGPSHAYGRQQRGFRGEFVVSSFKRGRRQRRRPYCSTYR